MLNKLLNVYIAWVPGLDMSAILSLPASTGSNSTAVLRLESQLFTLSRPFRFSPTVSNCFRGLEN